ncbi:hypothetical protein KGF56_000352 [Candida oxycetoniae]|uniref:Rxt3-domain-containing protein n=1 Tax=Candida oxycetoniae TaxID=497107 RepID=A0AAI9T182_9ASCO|nr:uncharacterized protein KGF56_000352 [Candida oxycetoniae]KAI3406747.2 hypothetical protein KGF56_000352 [Candida oxycetoniae]
MSKESSVGSILSNNSLTPPQPNEKSLTIEASTTNAASSSPSQNSHGHHHHHHRFVHHHHVNQLSSHQLSSHQLSSHHHVNPSNPHHHHHIIQQPQPLPLHHHHHHHHHHRPQRQTNGLGQDNQPSPQQLHLKINEKIEQDRGKTKKRKEEDEREREKREKREKREEREEEEEEERNLLLRISCSTNNDKLSKRRKQNTPKLNIEPIVQLISELFPKRQFLGTIIYNPTTTWDTLQTQYLYGLKQDLQRTFQKSKQNYRDRCAEGDFKIETRYIPCIPPLPLEYINSIIEVIIPFRHIIEFKQDFRNEIVSKERELWGGTSGIYTDDSDILHVLLHMGLFNDSVDLSQWNKTWTREDIIKPRYVMHSDNDDGSTSEEAKEKEQVDDDVYGDLSVEILLLPPLPQYIGYFQNGINARSWNVAKHNDAKQQEHSGLSYVVYNIRWLRRGSYLQFSQLKQACFDEMQRDYQENENLIKHSNGWLFDYKTFKRIHG